MVTAHCVGLGRTCNASVVLYLLAVSLCQGALPPDPNNAALLYYQAFLLCPQPDSDMRGLLARGYYSGYFDEKIRKYTEKCRAAIEYADKAGRIADCDWGIWYSQGLRTKWPQFPEAVISFAQVLHADARVLAADGDYRAAFERCLTIRMLSRHIGTTSAYSLASACAAEDCLHRCICQILGAMPPDAEMITWLKAQLDAVPPVDGSPAKALEMDMELFIQSGRIEHEIVDEGRRKLEPLAALGVENVQKAQHLSDEQLLAVVFAPYREYLGEALRVMSSDMAYEKAYGEIQRLTTDLQTELMSDPVTMIVGGRMEVLTEMVRGCYMNQVRHTAGLNVFSVAMELYLAKAKTGRLPERLPDGLPKDPYNGEDFVYTVTDEGFVLSCRVQPDDGGRPIRLECRVQQHPIGNWK